MSFIFFTVPNFITKIKMHVFFAKSDDFFRLFDVFLVLLYSFPILKATAKIAKSILTLSKPECLNRLYCLLAFVCPKTDSGSTCTVYEVRGIRFHFFV